MSSRRSRNLVSCELPPSLKELRDWTAVLKLYDRRFATGARKHEEAIPYDSTLETKYLEQLMEYPPADLDDDEDETEDEEEPETQILRHVQRKCLGFYNSEREVYRKFHPLQGRLVPKLFSPMRLEAPYVPATPIGATPSVQSYISIPGILIEHIPGFVFSDTKRCAPETDWKAIHQAAVGVVNEVASYHVLNHDVSSDNVIIRKDGSSHKAVMIDFAQARVRREDECDQEWREHKWMEDEESCIGWLMAGKLGVDFRPSEGGSLRWRAKAEDMKFLG